MRNLDAYLATVFQPRLECLISADIKHSNLGWNTVAKYASKLRMGDEVVDACEENLIVWDHYLNGIADAGDELDKKMGWRKKVA